MKKILYVLIISVMGGYAALGQKVEANLAEARTAYRSGNLEETRFALQQALNEMEVVVGNEVLKILPVKMGKYAYVPEEDNVVNMSGSFGGLTVSRSYSSGEGEEGVKISIVSDSPLLSGINALLSMPLIGGGDPNQKRIKIDGYKGMMTKSDGTEYTNLMVYDIQVPFGSSLLSITCIGINNESEVLSMSNTVPVSKIVELTK